MHVKHGRAQCPSVVVVWKLGERVASSCVVLVTLPKSFANYPLVALYHREASLLVRLVEGEERWETPDHPQGVLPHNWGGMEPNPTITCLVLKAKTNDRRKTSPLPSMNFVGLDLMLQSVTNQVA
ncbi:hypothetical protein TNCV_895871 [Trichonephila clavipes]|nr:hypothetical protein TNCV_895871 [Trichonephila clavipes]